MTNRAMRHSTNVSSPADYNNHHRPGPKTRTSPSTLLTTRSASRPKPHHRAHPLNLTKTCPLCPAATNTTHELKPSNLSRTNIDSSWRLGRIKPNAATENPSLLLNCPPRVNSTSYSILTLPDTHHPDYLPSYNHRNIPNLQTKRLY